MLRRTSEQHPPPDTSPGRARDAAKPQEAAAEPAASKVRKSQSKGTRNFEEGEIWEKGEGDGGDSTDSEDAADRVNLTNAVERTQKMLSARVSNAVTHYVGSPAEDPPWRVAAGCRVRDPPRPTERSRRTRPGPYAPAAPAPSWEAFTPRAFGLHP